MGTPVAEVRRKLGMRERTLYCWKRTFACLVNLFLFKMIPWHVGA
jgi:hypothetical protein